MSQNLYQIFKCQLNCTIQVINCRPKAVGSVRLVSSDPAVAPAITCNYLSRQEDLSAIAKGIATARKVTNYQMLPDFIRHQV